jgi:hypothetical protein
VIDEVLHGIDAGHPGNMQAYQNLPYGNQSLPIESAQELYNYMSIGCLLSVLLNWLSSTTANESVWGMNPGGKGREN